MQVITKKKLIKADFTFPVPFKIMLNDNAPLICNKLLRFKRHKHLVAEASWNSKQVIVKLFFQEKRAKKMWQQDANGIKTLMGANIATARLLLACGLSNEIYVIVYEKIAAPNLFDLWDPKNPTPRMMQWVHAVTLAIAKQHELGVLQRDLNLNNFLITPVDIYTLDGSMIQQQEQPISKPLGLEYLAQLIMRLGQHVTEESIKELCDDYLKARNLPIQHDDLLILQSSIKKLREEFGKRYLKRIYSNNSQFIKKTTFNRSIMHVYHNEYLTPEFTKFLQNPEKELCKYSTQILSSTPQQTRMVILINNHFLEVKCYANPPYWRRLLSIVRKSRATIAWHFYHKKYIMQYPSKLPVAYIASRFWGLKSKSYLIIET